MKMSRGGITFWSGVVVGALAMYVLDPTADRGRRVEINSRAQGMAHRTTRRLARTTRFGWSQVHGTEQRLIHRHPAAPADDTALVDRIESHIYRDPGVPKGSLNVEVVRGVTTVRGELPDEQAIDRVLGAVRGVAGVGEVRSLLHLPGRPAPNKEAALQATAVSP